MEKYPISRINDKILNFYYLKKYLNYLINVILNSFYF